MQAPTLEVKLEMVGRPLDQAERFRRNHGQDLVYDLLKDADLHGVWTFKLITSFKSSGRTPPIQVRRPEQGGVHLWVKPGSNDSGMKGTLVNRQHSGMTNQELYEKLKVAAERDKDTTPATVTHIEFTLSDEDAVLILDAVSEVCADPPAGGMQGFVDLIVEKLDSDEDADGAYWLEALEHLVDRHLLCDKRSHYELTGNGREMLEKGLKGQLPGSNGVHKPKGVVVQIGTEEGDVLLKASGKLAKIVAAAGKVTQLRAKERDVATQIEVKEKELAELRTQLLGLKEEEHKAAHGIDIAALSLLLEEVQ